VSNLTEQNQFPVLCGEGYSGYLCSICTLSNGIKYEWVSDNDCTKCIKAWTNVLWMIGFGLLILLYIYFLILINLWKSGSWLNSLSVLTWILTNYLQVITQTLSMNLAYPAYILQIFSPFSWVQGWSFMLFSFDCLF